MITKKSYIIVMNTIDIDEFIAATNILTDSISCSIAYHPHNYGEWWEVVVNCYDYDLGFVESTMAPFV